MAMDCCEACKNKDTTTCHICLYSSKMVLPTHYEKKITDCDECCYVKDRGTGRSMCYEKCLPSPTPKPPLGLTPRYIHKFKRIQDIREAVIRYSTENMVIPPEWIEEYNELIMEEL